MCIMIEFWCLCLHVPVCLLVQDYYGCRICLCIRVCVLVTVLVCVYVYNMNTCMYQGSSNVREWMVQTKHHHSLVHTLSAHWPLNEHRRLINYSLVTWYWRPPGTSRLGSGPPPGRVHHEESLVHLHTICLLRRRWMGSFESALFLPSCTPKARYSHNFDKVFIKSIHKGYYYITCHSIYIGIYSFAMCIYLLNSSSLPLLS